MSGSGSFGIKTTASYGTSPTIVPAKVLDRGSDTRGDFMFVQASGAVTAFDAGITLAQLAPQLPNLEETFFEMTGDK